MFYHARIHPNMRHPIVLSVRDNVQQIHKWIMAAYPAGLAAGPQTEQRSKHDVLWRADRLPSTGTHVIHIQSTTEPAHRAWERYDDRDGQDPERSWLDMDWPTELKHVNLRKAVVEGRRLRFNIAANPVHRDDNGRRKLIMDRGRRVRWMSWQGQRNGFEIDLDRLNMTWRGTVTGKHETAGEITLSVVQFDGLLTITDPGKFITALTKGIGRGKAYGCGMLSIAPPGRH